MARLVGQHNDVRGKAEPLQGRVEVVHQVQTVGYHDVVAELK